MNAMGKRSLLSRITVVLLMASGLWLATLNAPAQQAQVDQSFDKITQLVEQHYPHVQSLYFHLHAHPELSNHEVETAARLAEELRALGFAVTTEVGGTGVVAVLKNGEGPTVLVRADMDALPIKEESGKPYASEVVTKDDEGREVAVMHACGHDMHMANLIGTARVLNSMKDAWSGTLIVIGQPAEELGKGARQMLEDGLFTRFPRPDYCLAFHCDAGLPVGQVAYREGYAMANVDSVDITIRGFGGHGAYPHKTKDPVVIACQTVVMLQMIVSREAPPLAPAVVTVGSIHGGTKHNIIPDEVKLQLTVRSYSDEVRQLLLSAIERVTLGVAQAAGVPESLKPIVTVDREQFTPSTYNTPELVERATGVMKRLLGEENVIRAEPKTWGEDFGRYGREEPRIPIFMFTVGAVSVELWEASQREGGPPLPALHNSAFIPDPEPTLKTAMKAMSASALDLFQK